MPEPMPAPTKVVAMHLNYRSRAAERGKMPAHASYFLKPPSSIGTSGQAVERPQGCELLAFEGEIALIIGTRARNIAAADGWGHVGWVTAANDLGVYDLRYADSGSNVRSKGADGFTPLGPAYLVARDLDPASLRLRTWVNGVVVQDAVVAEEMLFDFGVVVADLARLMTLEPGDVILTGTPTGSTVVVPGDVVEVEVSAGALTTGRLRSPIVEATNPLAPLGAMPRTDADSIAAAWGAQPAVTTGDPIADRYGTEVSTALREVSTATLASQLRKRGLDGCLLDGLASSTPEQRMVGFARTVCYLPLREDLLEQHGGGFNAQKRAVENIQPGEVLVIGARGQSHAGTIGDILALRAQLRGAVGIVTDGAIRDAAAIEQLQIPTYSGGHHPGVLGRHHVPWQTDVAVACGGAIVQPGELLVGDADGVLVLPEQHVTSIVLAAVQQEREERFVVEQVRNGASVNGLYPLNAEWRSTYDSWTEGPHS